MINSKYFADMQAFPKQFDYTYDVTLPDTYPQKPRILLCGMWWSALYVPLVQDLLNYHQIDIRLESCSGYTLPPYATENTVIICASHSGNTEETISCFHEAIKNKAHVVVFTSGWQLMQLAQEQQIPYYHIPTGLQPRLSTWYFISALLDLLTQLTYPLHPIQKTLHAVSTSTLTETDQHEALMIAKEFHWKTPLIYTTDVLKSMSLISKIKLNENSKTPAFAHYIPELNHNEMCGWMGKTMEPYFLMFTSKFTHPRNLRRINIMRELLTQEGYTITIIDPKGDSLEGEAVRIYQFMDYVTYYLAEIQGIDPEPVQMVEDFKQMLG